MAESIVTDRLSEELDKLLGFADTLEIKRAPVICKLEEAISKMTIDPDNDGDKVTMAKMSVVNTYFSALKDSDSTKRENVKILQKQKSDDKNVSGDIIAAFLTKLGSGEITAPKVANQGMHRDTEEDLEQILNERCEQEGLTYIQEAELSFQSKDVDINEVMKR